MTRAKETLADHFDHLQPIGNERVRSFRRNQLDDAGGHPSAFVFIRTLQNFVTTVTTTNNNVAAFLERPTAEGSDAVEALYANFDPMSEGRKDALLELIRAESKIIDPTDAFEPTSHSGDVDITVLGMGILPEQQLTLEGAHVLKNASKVLCVATQVEIDQLKAAHGDKFVNLAEATYKEGENRIEAYLRMAASVIDSSFDEKVVFGLYGHPSVFAYPPLLVKRIGEKLGKKVRILPGISSMDTLFADLMFDPGANGLLMYEATDILLRKRAILPDVPLIVWQIGSLETVLFSTADSRRGRFDSFRDYMLQFYPDDHPVVAYCAPNRSDVPTFVHVFELQDFCKQAELLSSGITLLFPAASTLPVRDHELLKRIADPAHLASISGQES